MIKREPRSCRRHPLELRRIRPIAGSRAETDGQLACDATAEHAQPIHASDVGAASPKRLDLACIAFSADAWPKDGRFDEKAVGRPKPVAQQRSRCPAGKGVGRVSVQTERLDIMTGLTENFLLRKGCERVLLFAVVTEIVRGVIVVVVVGVIGRRVVTVRAVRGTGT